MPTTEQEMVAVIRGWLEQDRTDEAKRLVAAWTDSWLNPQEGRCPPFISASVAMEMIEVLMVGSTFLLAVTWPIAPAEPSCTPRILKS
jgi:hypothetical protein